MFSIYYLFRFLYVGNSAPFSIFVAAAVPPRADGGLTSKRTPAPRQNRKGEGREGKPIKSKRRKNEYISLSLSLRIWQSPVRLKSRANLGENFQLTFTALVESVGPRPTLGDTCPTYTTTHTTLAFPPKKRKKKKTRLINGRLNVWGDFHYCCSP